MNYAAIKKQLAILDKILTPRPLVVTVEINGRCIEKLASEWWQHRDEWRLADFNKQKGNGIVVCLVLAEMFDEAIKTEKNKDEAARMKEECNAMLDIYFGGSG